MKVDIGYFFDPWSGFFLSAILAISVIFFFFFATLAAPLYAAKSMFDIIYKTVFISIILVALVAIYTGYGTSGEGIVISDSLSGTVLSVFDQTLTSLDAFISYAMN